MIGVHVGMYLKYEACELIFARFHGALHGLYGSGGWCDAHKAIKQFLHAKGVERRTKEDGCHYAIAVIECAELWIHSIDELDVGTQFLGIVAANGLVNSGVVNVTDVNTVGHMLLVGLEQTQVLLIDVIDTLEF